MQERLAMHDQRNRYPGIKPFTVAEKELFFGREKDTEDLHGLLFIKQMMVLYGKSGSGKSSLINAGIIPKLEAEDNWTCFTIRFNNFSERADDQNVSPLNNIRFRLQQEVTEKTPAFLESFVTHKNKSGTDDKWIKNSVWYWAKAIQLSKKRNRFIFFFDQFEELFTYPKEMVDEFSFQLAQLLYNTVPADFRKWLAYLDEEGLVNEELHHFIYHQRPEIKVVFSVRSDRLSLLNALKDHHPDILKNCYELDALSREEAEEAIVNPARQPQIAGFATSPFEFTSSALKKILDSVADIQDNKIETATLQIVCRYVEDELVTAKNLTTITGNDLGNIADIFKKYYEGILDKLSSEERSKAQHLIEDELIEEGRRNTLTEGYIKRNFGVDEKLLLQLEQSSLLRKERDASGRILYEISHDTLVTAIEKVAQGRRAIEEEAKHEKLKQQLEEERQRTEQLEELNKKVVFRARLALAFAIAGLLGAGLALFFYIRAIDSRKEAIDNAMNAQQQENNARVALFRNNLQKANMLIDDVKNSYLLSDDDELAEKNLNAAYSLLMDKKAELETKDENERRALLDSIETYRRQLK